MRQMREIVAEAIISEVGRQLDDGVGHFDDSGGPAFITIGGEVDFEKVADVAIKAYQAEETERLRKLPSAVELLEGKLRG